MTTFVKRLQDVTTTLQLRYVKFSQAREVIRSATWPNQRQPSLGFRDFSLCCSLGVKQLPPRPKIIEDEIVENFLKGSGPGGQKINKTSVAVQLLHKPTGTVVKCQATRSRTQNRTIARKLLGDKLDELEKGPESRKALKAEAERKKKASKTKKANRKYKTAAEGEPEDGEESSGEDNGTEVIDTLKEVKMAADEELPDWERKWRELRGIE